MWLIIYVMSKEIEIKNIINAMSKEEKNIYGYKHKSDTLFLDFLRAGLIYIDKNGTVYLTKRHNKLLNAD